MNILFTAFKGKFNSSFILINELNKDKQFITNSFSGLQRDIDRIVNQNYDSIIMIGLDKSLKDKIKIELTAQKNNNVLNSDFDLQLLLIKLERYNINHAVSMSPTSYLCNAAYYYVLDNISKMSIFIHIPSKKNISKEYYDKLIMLFNSL